MQSDLLPGQNGYTQIPPQELAGSVMAAPYQYTPVSPGQHNMTLVNAAACTFTNGSAAIAWTGAALAVGQKVTLVNSGGALPTGFAVPAAAGPLFVSSSSANTFQLSATLGGAAIVAGSAGTGTDTFTANTLTVPPNAAYGKMVGSTAAIRFTTDGTTNPSSTVGMPITNGTFYDLLGPAVLANIKLYGAATATLDVEYTQ